MLHRLAVGEEPPAGPTWRNVFGLDACRFPVGERQKAEGSQRVRFREVPCGSPGRLITALAAGR